MGLPTRPGLLVEAVRPSSPAGQAGVRAGDLLVRSGARDLRSLTCLHHAVRAAGHELDLDLLRAERPISVTLDLPP